MENQTHIRAYFFRGFDPKSRSLLMPGVNHGTCIGRPGGVVMLFDSQVPARSGDVVKMRHVDADEHPNPHLKYIFWSAGHWFFTTAYSIAIPDSSGPIEHNYRGVAGTLVAELHYLKGRHASFSSEKHESADRYALARPAELIRENREQMRYWIREALPNCDVEMAVKEFVPDAQPYVSWSQVMPFGRPNVTVDVASERETAKFVAVQRRRFIGSLQKQMVEEV